MLKIVVPGLERYDDDKNRFIIVHKDKELTLEHSLVSLSKWESKWKKPFIGRNDRSPEELIDYIRYMTLTQHVDESTYDRLSPDNILKIKEYIEDEMTATVINDSSEESKRPITSELLYCWMFSLGIPIECQKWHLNRLITLIRVCSIEMNHNKKKMSQQEIYEQNRRLNAERRRALNSKG